MTPIRQLRRGLAATVGALALAAGVSGSVLAADSSSPNPRPPAGRTAAAAIAPLPAGSELQYVSVAPCRILDTRIAVGVMVNTTRVYDASLGTYAAQGGKPGTCNVPENAAAVQVNLAAISQGGSSSFLKAWPTGTPEPNASMLNYDPSGPVANMVTLPVDASGDFTLKTPGRAHVFADVTGYYVKPLYVAVTPAGGIYQGASSGVVSVVKTGLGRYTVTFDRDVSRCSAVASSIVWSSNVDVSPDTAFGGNRVLVGTATPAGAPVDEYFYLSVDC